MIVSKHLPLGKRGCFAEAEPIRFSPAKTINSLENYEISTNACHPDTIKGSHKDNERCHEEISKKHLMATKFKKKEKEVSIRCHSCYLKTGNISFYVETRLGLRST